MTTKTKTYSASLAKLGFIPVLLSAMMVFSGAANASCSTYGKVAKVYLNSSASTPYAYGYIQPKSTGPVSYWFYFYTNKASTIAMLNSAQSGNETVYVSGNQNVCPTSGAYRYGGTVNNVSSFELY